MTALRSFWIFRGNQRISVNLKNFLHQVVVVFVCLPLFSELRKVHLLIWSWSVNSGLQCQNNTLLIQTFPFSYYIETKGIFRHRNMMVRNMKLHQSQLFPLTLTQRSYSLRFVYFPHWFRDSNHKQAWFCELWTIHYYCKKKYRLKGEEALKSDTEREGGAVRGKDREREFVIVCDC